MIAHDFFRLSLAEATRLHKRSAIFRHVLFAVGELYDPLEPDVPFNMQAPLPEIEREWHFRRAEGVPAWIQLYVGRGARERSLAKLAEEYTLPPAERFKRIETTVKMEQYSTDDPDTWDTGYFCAIQIPAEFSFTGVRLFWCGNRSVALTDPDMRRWFFDPRAKISHGDEAVALARQEFSKTGGAK